MTSLSTRTPRVVLCLAGLLFLIAALAWASPAYADDTLPPGTDKELDDVMMPDENGSQPGDGRDDDGDGSTNEEDEEVGGGSEDDTGSDDGGLAERVGKQVFGGILADIVDSIADAAAGWATKMLTEQAFALPEPEGEIKLFYERMGSIVQPGAIALLLLTGLMLMLRGTSYNTAYATQHALPKIVIFFAGLAFFPEIMTLISDLARGMGEVLVDPSKLSEAFENVLVGRITPGPGGLLDGLIVIVTAVLLLFLFVMCLFKTFLFGVLFIAGPLAMFVYPISSLSGLAAQWFKAMIACVAIPLLWAVEASIGSQLIASPESIFGAGVGLSIYSGLLTIILAWVMVKTPFKVFEWCFYGYSSGSGLISHVARSAVARAIIKGR